MRLGGLGEGSRDSDSSGKGGVSEHAFLIDGWLEMKRADELERALEDSCLHVEIAPFEMEAEEEDMGTQTTIIPSRCLRFLIKREVHLGQWNY